MPEQTIYTTVRPIEQQHDVEMCLNGLSGLCITSYDSDGIQRSIVINRACLPDFIHNVIVLAKRAGY